MTELTSARCFSLGAADEGVTEPVKHIARETGRGYSQL